MPSGKLAALGLYEPRVTALGRDLADDRAVAFGVNTGYGHRETHEAWAMTTLCYTEPLSIPL